MRASPPGFRTRWISDSPWSGSAQWWSCLLYTSDAADDLLCVDLGGRRIIKKKSKHATAACTTATPPLLVFFKQKTAYEIMPSLVGSEMCIRDRWISDSPWSGSAQWW